MKNNETLSKFMIEEHGKILVLLEDFKKNSKLKDARDYYDKLKWKQENHVLAEEKAIMLLTADGTTNQKLKATIILILKQHDEIRDIMKKLQEKLQRNMDHYEENMKKLLDIMKIHITLENKSFYPVLDRDFQDEDKKLLMSKFREVIIGNISL